MHVLGAKGLAGLLLAFAVSAAAADRPDVRTSFYNGRPVTYEVIGGLAIFEGDIVLGTAAELEAARPPVPQAGRREAMVISPLLKRWPNAVVPYVADPALANQARLLDAIEYWNANTPIRLEPRTNQGNWVRFFRFNNGLCSSSVGMTGLGEQRINLDDACTTRSIIHEIGHAVGLWHEQSRADRDRYVSVLYRNIDKRYVYNFDQELTNGEDVGSFDAGSIMHYSAFGFSRNGQATIETIPPGIPIGVAQALSAADIDGVRRLYEQPASSTTITTNPAGLDVLVDDVRYTAPMSFEWAPASTHTLSVPSPQGDSAPRYVFGRWSDDGAETHMVTASPALTVFSASFVEQYRLTADVFPAGGGAVAISPPSADGFYANRTGLELTAAPAAGYSFLEWRGTQSASANPKQVAIQGTNFVTALFTQSTVTTVSSNPPGRRVSVDRTIYTAPVNFAWSPGSRHTLDVVSPQTSGLARYFFRGWDNGDEEPQTVTASAEPATYTASFTAQYLLTAAASPSTGGTVAVNPASPDGYYDRGATVELTATPAAQYRLDYWSGDWGGLASPLSLVVKDQAFVTANFVRPSTASFAAVNAASYSSDAVAPGEIVVVFGNNLGPQTLALSQLDGSGKVPTELAGTRIYFDGVPAPLIYVQASQAAAVVPFSVAGQAATRLQVDYQGRRSAILTLTVAATAPGVFSLDMRGRGPGAILNEGGASVNSPSQPAPRGSVIVIYATGAGQTDPPGEDGLVPTTLLPKPVLPVTVRIGGSTATVEYAGAAPYSVSGLLQINARVPLDIEPGDYVPVILTIGGQSSLPAVTVAVR